MKYCTECGNQVVDNAVVCPKCGCITVYGKERNRVIIAQRNQAIIAQKNENNKTGPGLALGILSLVFGALGGWLGLLFGILCICLDKTKKYRVLGVLGIILFILWIVILILIQ